MSRPILSLNHKLREQQRAQRVECERVQVKYETIALLNSHEFIKTCNDMEDHHDVLVSKLIANRVTDWWGCDGEWDKRNSKRNTRDVRISKLKRQRSQREMYG